MRKKSFFKINKEIVLTSNVTQSAIIGNNGWYSTAVSTAKLRDMFEKLGVDLLELIRV